MNTKYEMITVADYFDKLYNVEYLNIEEKEIEEKLEKYLLSVQRAKTNVIIVEALLA